MPLLALAIAPFRNSWLRMHFHMQHEYDAHNLGIASAKIPPAWSPERDRIYPLRTWVQDVRLWSVGTDVDEDKQGPVCAMRIGGTGKDLIRELDVNVLSNGMLQPDAQGNPVQVTGLEMLIRALERRYGPLAQELEVHSIAELLQFRRNAGEDTDSVVNRFNLTKARAFNGAGFDMSWVGFGFLLLTILGIPKTSWPLLLAPTQGALPRTQAEYEAFCQYVRRQGHLTDRNVDTVKNMAFLATTEQTDAYPMTYKTAPYEQQALTPWHEPVYPNPAYAAVEQSYNSTEADSDDGLSSANSGDSIPDLSDVLTLPLNTAGEQLYLAYRHSKRRWRSFTGGFKRSHFRRHRKGKGKGKRHGKSAFGKTFGKSFKGKGKGKNMFFLDEMTGNFVPVADDGTQTYMTDENWDQDDEQVVYLGNSGKFRRKNPKGKDGKTLLCSMCGSDEHLIKKCSRNKQGLNFTQHQQQQGNSTFMSQASASSDGNQWSRPIYFGAESESMHCHECSIEIDGATVVLGESSTDRESSQPTSSSERQRHYYMPEPPLPRNPTLSQATSNASALERQFAFAWFMPFYHAQVRCQGLEGLLVDVGAIGNLCGSAFIKRVTEKALKFGHGSVWQKLDKKLSVEGVGKESDTTQDEVIAPICLPDGRTGTYTTPVIENSELPALLGLKTLSQERALIDCFNKQIIFVGPGGYRLQASPGSRTYKLHTAATGHLLLPCDCWESAKMSAGEKQLVF